MKNNICLITEKVFRLHPESFQRTDDCGPVPRAQQSTLRCHSDFGYICVQHPTAHDAGNFQHFPTLQSLLELRNRSFTDELSRRWEQNSFKSFVLSRDGAKSASFVWISIVSGR